MGGGAWCPVMLRVRSGDDALCLLEEFPGRGLGCAARLRPGSTHSLLRQRLLQRNLITVFSTVNTLVMFFPTVSRHHAAVSRTNVPHRRGVDASRHACTTPVLFEKAHEKRCFQRSPCWRTRTDRTADTNVAHTVGMSQQWIGRGSCRVEVGHNG